MRLLSRLDLPPARYQIRVGAFEASGGGIGTVPYDVDVPDYSRTPFALSGILLTSSADTFVTPNPDPELKDVISGPPVVTRRFSPLETLTLFAELYDNSSQTTHTDTVVTTVRDARDGQTVFESRDELEASSKVQALGHRKDVPLKGLSPGMYVLRVEATSSIGEQSTHREVMFEVTGSATPRNP